MRFVFVLLAGLIALSGCVPATTGTNAAYPENFQTTQCFSGDYAFTVALDVPREYGRVLASTQFENGSAGLSTVCRLVGDGRVFEVYSGEVSNGASGMCVSLRTQNAGHVISCASQRDVRRAVNAPRGTAQDIIPLTQWRQFTS